MLLLLKVKYKGKLVRVFNWISCHEDVWIDSICTRILMDPRAGVDKPCFLDCLAHILVTMVVNLKQVAEMACDFPDFLTSFVKLIQKLQRKESGLNTSRMNARLTSRLASWPPKFLVQWLALILYVWEMLFSILPMNWISQLRTSVFLRNLSPKMLNQCLKIGHDYYISHLATQPLILHSTFS